MSTTDTAKFTPGPWRYSTSPQPNGCPIVGASGLMVCMLAHSVNHPDQEATAIANARLIEAAPELLEALQETVAALEAEYSHRVVEVNFKKALAAIAKATGKDAS